MKKNVKSVGNYYPIGTVMKAVDYHDETKMRRGKVKVSEGLVVLFKEGDPKNTEKATQLEKRLEMTGLADAIAAALNPAVVPTVVEEPVAPKLDVIKPEPKQAVKPKAKAVTFKTEQAKAN